MSPWCLAPTCSVLASPEELMKSWSFWEMTSFGFLGDVYLRIQRNAGCDSGYVFHVSPGSFCASAGSCFTCFAEMDFTVNSSFLFQASTWHIARDGSFSDGAALTDSFGASCGLDSVQFPLCLC